MICLLYSVIDIERDRGLLKRVAQRLNGFQAMTSVEGQSGSGTDVACVVRPYRSRLPSGRQPKTSSLLRSGKTHHVMA
jgi:hypothetical protein